MTAAMKETYRIFIVEDDPWYAEMMKHHLSKNPDYTIHLFSNASDCLDNLYQKPDVVCIDFELPDMTGDLLLKKIKEHNLQIPAIVISGQENINVVVKLFKLGTIDYIIKNEHTRETLWNTILKIRENSKLRKELQDLKDELGQKYAFSNTVIGQSAIMRKVHALMEKATHTNINISIFGESGTGKEVVAKAIHYNSERRPQPFVIVNIASIPKEHVESELFGYEKGMYQGAPLRKIGKLEEAESGTILLDEITELDLGLQSKLLDVLQDRELYRMGATTPIKFNARLISTSTKRLADEVKNGNFREDLYYRILGLPIELPPLRERGSDIVMLASYFTKCFSKENKSGEYNFSDEAVKKLITHTYPGNIRELKATIDLACVLCSDNLIKDNDITFTNIKNGRIYSDEEKTLRAYTIEIIGKFLKKYNHNVVEVAKRLDIGKSTIYNMIQKKELVND